MSMRARFGQCGATLFMTLILLLILTLFVVSAVTTSTSNLRVVGNMQAQSEAEAAGQQVIAKFISDATNFNPPAVSATVNVDVNNDTKTDYVVTRLQPALRGAAQLGGSSYSITGNMNTWWEVTACVKPVTANLLGANTWVAIHQGVRVPLPASAVPITIPPAQTCPP